MAIPTQYQKAIQTKLNNANPTVANRGGSTLDPVVSNDNIYAKPEPKVNPQIKAQQHLINQQTTLANAGTNTPNRAKFTTEPIPQQPVAQQLSANQNNPQVVNKPVNNIDELYKNAYDAMIKAKTSLNQNDINDARNKLSMLNNTDASFAMPEFSKQLDEAQMALANKLKNPFIDEINKYSTVHQMKTPEEYAQMAQNQYNPIYNEQRQAVENALALAKQQYEKNKGNINENYDLAKQGQNLSNTKAKNNISNVALGRGFTRGTIVGSQLAEADQINAGALSDLDRRRMAELGNIDDRVGLLTENTSNELKRLDADKAMRLADLARQLEDRDSDKNYRDRGLALQALDSASNRDFRERQFDYMKDKDNRDYEFDRERYADSINRFRESMGLEREKYQDSINRFREGMNFDREKYQDAINRFREQMNLSQEEFNTKKDQWEREFGTRNDQWEREFGTKNDQWEREFSANNDFRNRQLAQQAAAQRAAQQVKQQKASELSNWEAQQRTSLSNFYNNIWDDSNGKSMSYTDKASYLRQLADSYASVPRDDYRRLASIAYDYSNKLLNIVAQDDLNASLKKGKGNYEMLY